MPCIVIFPGSSFVSSGMTKSGSQSWATSSTWVDITSWAADTTNYPGSTVTSNKLDVQGAKSNATLSASVPFTGGFFSNTHTIRLVDQNGTVIATGSGVSADNSTCTVTANNVDLSAITRVGVQMNCSSNNGGSVSSGSGTSLTIT